MFFAQVFPEVISFNTGVPFQPFSRNPQIKYSYKLKDLKFIATAYTLRDFPSIGPVGTTITIQRNAAIPNANFSFIYSPSDSKNVFGAGIDYKTVLPQIETDKGYKTDETISGISATFVSKLVFNKITWKLQGVYAQNAFDILGIGGYAMKENTYDNITGVCQYTNINTGTLWTELYYKNDKFITGVFGGYTKNMGSDDNIETTSIYARGGNIEYLYRVSPRFAFYQGKSTIGLELEYTAAVYGTIDNKSSFSNTKEVSNIRALLSFIYSF